MVEGDKNLSLLRNISDLQASFSEMTKEFQALMNNSEIQQAVLKQLGDMFQKFTRMREALSSIMNYFDSILQKKPRKNLSTLSIIDTINIPDNLRKSMMAVIRFGKATAEKVASRTKREPTVEEEYLSMLVQMGHLNVESKDGKQVYSFSMGKRKSRISDEIWKSLIKDRTEMINFVCSTEIEKSELKKMDLDEMKKMVSGIDEDLNAIKSYLNEYITSLSELQKKYKF
ncbi:MAG: hypothetical protein ACTSRW_14800 [Candidatus Helarchaeota archaeon]